MKLSTGIRVLSSKNLDKKISKKILYANTSANSFDKKAQDKAIGVSNDPLYHTSTAQYFNPDIRYRNYFAFSPLANIDYRNNLLMFAENKEIKKAVDILANELVVMESPTYKYPLYPSLNLTQIGDDKQNVGQAIIDYINKIFYPKLWKMLRFKKGGLIKMIKEFLITGKVAYEIIYDNIKNPKEIIGIQPLDAGCLQKFKEGDNTYYVQRNALDAKERVLHENQVILLEWNEYDYGYISYVDGLRMSFNTMRSMQTSKILWFAAKSQVRMHIKLALGDISRDEAKQRLSEARNDYTNLFSFGEDGVVRFNNQPNNSGYREFFTAETAASGHPEIEEVDGQGPDLSEVDSLQYWERLFWGDTGIPFDRIDPSSTDAWGFLDVDAQKKTEIIFSKYVNAIRTMLEDVVLKPLIVQLTLKEVEIGIDLSLLDSIQLNWVAYNQYEKMADLEIMAKRVELADNIKEFGTMTNAAGDDIVMFPVSWIARNYLELDEDTMELLERERDRELSKLGFEPSTKPTEEFIKAEAMSTGKEIQEEPDENPMDDILGKIGVKRPQKAEASEQPSVNDKQETAEEISANDDESFE